MKINKLASCFIILLLFACNSNSDYSSYLSEEEIKSDLISDLFSEDNVQQQSFTIDNSKDTIIVSRSGSSFKIYANSFIDSNNNLIQENIHLKLIEAIKPIDFVMANLTTVTPTGLILQSGGMFNVRAFANEKELSLKKGKEIGALVPKELLDPEMFIFSGERVDGDMTWDEPRLTFNEDVIALEQRYVTVTYYHYGEDKATVTENSLVQTWLFEKERQPGDTITFGNSHIEVVGISKNTEVIEDSTVNLFIQEVIVNKGKNGYVSDFNMSYIFSINQLGWTNIDRFYEDPSAQPVSLILDVLNSDDFDYVHTTLMLKNKNVFIPGYQKMDFTYSFAQDDSQDHILPIGDTAIFMASAYKNNQRFIDIQKMVIQNEMDIEMQLAPIEKSEFKKYIESYLK